MSAIDSDVTVPIHMRAQHCAGVWDIDKNRPAKRAEKNVGYFALPSDGTRCWERNQNWKSGKDVRPKTYRNFASQRAPKKLDRFLLDFYLWVKQHVPVKLCIHTYARAARRVTVTPVSIADTLTYLRFACRRSCHET